MRRAEPMPPQLPCWPPAQRSGDARRAGWWPALLVLAAMPAGCINVTAPEEPIVIELNVNIRQEVIYRLAADANNLIDENEDIF